MPSPDSAHFSQPVLTYVRPHGPLLQREMSVAGALETIRQHGTEERIIYFYVVDEEQRLVGVLPTRRLLTARVEAPLAEVMIPRVLAVPAQATLLDACELFVLHKFLALPVIDAERHVVGVLDIGVFTEEVLELSTEPEKPDELFEALGFRLEQVRGASPLVAFRFRFPWLMATITSGTLAAMIAGSFEETLAHNLVIACFLALVLALAEAVSIQSMTLTLQALRSSQPTWRWFFANMRRELQLAVLLGLACGAVVFCVTWLWRGAPAAAGVIGVSVFGALLIACAAGMSVPTALHALKLDPKIAAGPAALALADVLTLLLYLSLASWLL